MLTGTEGVLSEIRLSTIGSMLTSLFWGMLTSFMSGIPTSSFIDRSRLLAVGLIKNFLETVLEGMLTGTVVILSETWLSFFESMSTSLF